MRSGSMLREQVLIDVRKRVQSLPGVIAFQYLDKDFRRNLMILEREAEANGACGGLMPFINKGVWSAFEREEQFVIVASGDAILLGVSSGLVFIEDQKGQIVGEWLNDKRLEELKGQDNVCFLSQDFVLYNDVQIVGEPRFVLPDVDFPYLDDIEDVQKVASGSISTLADDYVRERLGYAETKHWTHLVGFNIAKD